MSKTCNSERSALREMSVNSMAEQMPLYVKRYRPVPSDLPRVLPVRHKLSTVNEKKLRRFFKCTKFNLKLGPKGVQCFATRNDDSNFGRHLKTRHPNDPLHYCCYCYPKPSYSSTEIKPEDYMSCDNLIKHMITVHRLRRYQCNLCLYRAISPDHVSIHQKRIHANIYAETLKNKELDGKSCKIIECPPPVPNTSTPPPPSALKFYQNHKYRRLNNEGNNAKNYQCVYCSFMNESQEEVVTHCVHSHPDYPILYYNPDPEVTSTRSPDVPQMREIDLFGSNNETQVNRVSSTDTNPGRSSPETSPSEESAYVTDILEQRRKLEREKSELAFQPKQKQRISAVQTVAQKNVAGLSKTSLNHDQPFRPRPKSGPKSRVPQYNRLGVSTSSHPNWKPNQTTTTRPTSAPFKKSDPIRRVYASDSDEEPVRRTNVGLNKPSTSGQPQRRPTVDLTQPSTSSAGLPPLISPKKTPQKNMICQKCTGSVKLFTFDQINSHLQTHHNIKNKNKENRNLIPFMCGHCKDFTDAETDAGVRVHHMGCSKKPEGSEPLIEKLIITEENYKKKYASKVKGKPRPKETEPQPKEPKPKPKEPKPKPKEPKTKPKETIPSKPKEDSPKTPKCKKKKSELHLNYLSTDSEEEVQSKTYGNKSQDIDSDSDGWDRTPSLRKQKKKTPQKFEQLIQKRNQKQSKPKSKQRRTDSSTSSERNGYRSSDDSEPEVLCETPRQPKTKTTLIEKANSEVDTESETDEQYVCLFCEMTFSKKIYAGIHLEERHFEDINELMDDYQESKSAKRWMKDFLSDQMSEFEEEESEDYDEPHYRCPICVKIGRIKSKSPKHYQHFSDAKIHFLRHCGWKSVLCLKCEKDEKDSKRDNRRLFNCDYLIAQHLRRKHDEQFWNSLSEDTENEVMNIQAKDDFSDLAKEELIQQGFINILTFRNDVIDKQIDLSLKQMAEDYDNQLIEDAEYNFYRKKNQKINVSLPKVMVKRLPQINFDDEDMLSRYLMDLGEITGRSREDPQIKRRRIVTISSDDETDNEEAIRPISPSMPQLGREDIVDEDMKMEQNVNQTEDCDDIKDMEVDEESDFDDNFDLDDIDELEVELKPEVSQLNQTNANPQTSQIPIDNLISTPNRRFKCYYCQQKYDNKREIKNHVSESHADKAIRFEAVRDDD